MNYLIDLVKEHHITSNFENVNIIDYKLAKKHNLLRDTKNKKDRMPSYFFGVIGVLVKLNVLKVCDYEFNKGNENGFFVFKTYNINKHPFLVFYSLVMALNDFNNRKNRFFNADNCEDTILFLFNTITKFGENNMILTRTFLGSVIEKTYSHLATIFSNALQIENVIVKSTFNNYVKTYINAIEAGEIKPLGPSFATANLTASWFSDCFCGKEQLEIVSDDFINEIAYSQQFNY